MTHAEIRALLAASDPAGLRTRAGISLRTVARALGVGHHRVWHWENRRRQATGSAGAAYARFIAGLARHEAGWSVRQELDAIAGDPDGADVLPGHARLSSPDRHHMIECLYE